jgi:hypothetical protein
VIPSAWQMILLTLAAYRTWRLAAVDEIGDRPRGWLLDRAPWLEHWLRCPWCAGFWFTAAWWAGWLIWPHAALVAAVPFAASLLVGLVARNLDP